MGLKEISLVKKVRKRKSDAKEFYSFVELKEIKETNMSKQNRNKFKF